MLLYQLHCIYFSLQSACGFDSLKNGNNIAWPNAEFIEASHKVLQRNTALENSQLGIFTLIDCNIRAGNHGGFSIFRKWVRLGNLWSFTDLDGEATLSNRHGTLRGLRRPSQWFLSFHQSRREPLDSG